MDIVLSTSDLVVSSGSEKRINIQLKMALLIIKLLLKVIFTVRLQRTLRAHGTSDQKGSGVCGGHSSWRTSGGSSLPLRRYRAMDCPLRGAYLVK